MLERTAATLEPCTFQRSLPSSARTRRKLHTGFWQHGAAALDLSSLWEPSCQDQGDAKLQDASPQTPPDRLVASTFLLDFLYPRGTAAFLRRLSPNRGDKRTTTTSGPSCAKSRLFTSTSYAPPFEASDSTETFQQEPALAPSRGVRTIPTIPNNSLMESNHIPPKAKAADPWADSEHAIDVRPTSNVPFSQPETLEKLMSRNDPQFYGKAWDLFLQLEPHEQERLRPSVIAYLHSSTDPVDAGRVAALFSQLKPFNWSTQLLSAAVAAQIRLGDIDQALKMYRNGLQKMSMYGGMTPLLNHALRESDWNMVRQVWQDYLARTSGFPGFPAANPLLAVPSLGTQVLAFRDHLELQPEFANVKRSFDPLIKAFAKSALSQPCKPHEALPLLNIVSDPRWYERYLDNAFRSHQAEAQYLPDIYRVGRSFANFRPGWRILHGMFEVFFPHDITGLEQVYEDWHSMYGELDQWGYRKYLKLYAWRGDIRSFQRLWDVYVRKYKDEAQSNPEALNHLMSAHSKRGDLAAVRKLFNGMEKRHGLKPDVVSWNILLTTHVQLDLYDEAINVFQDLCEAVRPDARSFAIIMSMTSIKGDLDLTLAFYERLKNSRVQADSAIFAAIVEAYLQNDRFGAAKIACNKLARMKVPGDQAHIWNRLLKAYGRIQKLTGVYRTLDRMEKFGIPWNAATHELLLQALVYCKQTARALRLLQNTVESKSFPVTARQFELVMSSAIQTREDKLVPKVRELMAQAGLPDSMEIMDAVLQKSLRRASRQQEKGSHTVATDEKADFTGEELVQYFQKTLAAEARASKHWIAAEDRGAKEQGAQDIDTTAQDDTGDSDLTRSSASFRRPAQGPTIARHRVKTRLVQRAVIVLTRFKDLVSTEKLLEVYERSIAGLSDEEEKQQQQQNKTKQLPLPLIEAIMYADFSEGKYVKVKETWELAWVRALELGRPASYKGKGILPQHRYDLSAPFNVMRQVLTRERNPEALLALLQRVRAEGFKLHGRDWNHLCATLTSMGRWVEACRLCEEVLMPSWRGWHDVRAWRFGKRRVHMPKAKQHRGNDPRFARPNAQMLLTLGDELTRLSREAMWSVEMAEQVAQVSESCPRLMIALQERKKFDRGEASWLKGAL